MSRFLTENDSVIFLDIDGVMNNPIYMIQSKEHGRAIDPTAVHILNRLIEATDALVVLSSVWRYDHSPEQMTEVLRKKGFEYEIFSSTPDIQQGNRGNEIEKWLNQYTPAYLNFNQYVILDDDSDMTYWQRDKLFICPNDVGLTPSIAYKAYRSLMSSRNWTENRDNSNNFGMNAFLDSRKIKVNDE